MPKPTVERICAKAAQAPQLGGGHHGRCALIHGHVFIGGEKDTGGGREAGSDAWKNYLCRHAIGLALFFGLHAAAGALELELPIAPADAAFSFLGVAGFGYHVSEHRYDGHPGLDFEYRVGGKVRAAMGGKLNYFSDVHDPGKLTVQIDFSADGKNWRNVYTNIGALEPGLDKGSTVATGQVIGAAGSVSFTSGANTLSYAMSHFQLDDMSGAVRHGLSNTTAVSPVPYFSATAKAAFDGLASQATYRQQLCEPLMSSPRGLLAYPTLTRRWSLSTGALTVLAARIDFTCDHSDAAARNGYAYSMFDAGDTLLESGTVTVDTALSALPKIDFEISGGGKRLGVYAIDGTTATLRLDYSAPGGNRPSGFSAAAAYLAEAGVTSCAAATDVVCMVGEASPYRSGQQLNLSLAVHGDRIAGAANGVDLWAALVGADGVLRYFTAEGLSTTPAAWRGALALKRGQATVVPLLSAVDVVPALAGTYALYALVAPQGTAPERLLDARLGNLMTISTAIQP